MEELKKYIRDVPDFPKPGILFKDITPILQNGEIFKQVVDQLAERYRSQPIDRIVGIESRGFIFGAPLAYALKKGFALVRKSGKLPWKTVRWDYELEYGTDTIEMHADAVQSGEKVLIIDDLLATGGTALATSQLVEKMGGKIIECAFVVELEFLNGRKKLENKEVFSLLKY